MLAAFGSVCRILLRLLPSSFPLPVKSLHFLALSVFQIINDMPGLNRNSSSFKDWRSPKMCYVPVNHCCTEMTLYGIQRSQLVARISQLSSRYKAMAASPSRCKRPFYCLSNAIPRPGFIAMLDFGCSRISCKLSPYFFFQKKTKKPLCFLV